MTNLIPNAQAKQAAEQFVHTVALNLDAHILGSIRRGRAQVKDVEILYLCQTLDEKRVLLRRLDHLCNTGTIARNLRNPKWGDTYRAAIFNGVPFDIFTSDPHNHGYIQWLRTGPGDTNMWFMSQLVRHKSPVRCQSGYVWHVSYDLQHPDYNKALGYAKLGKLTVPTEWSFFKLFGLPYVKPADRNQIRYGSLNRGVHTPPGAVLRNQYVTPPRKPKQQRLF